MTPRPTPARSRAARLAAASRRRKSKPRAPAAFRPWPVVLICVDTAKNSGWAISYAGELIASGEVKITNRAEMRRICREALDTASDMVHTPPVVLVLEKPLRHHTKVDEKGHRHSVVTASFGLGKAHQEWESVWREEGQAARRIARVSPQTWRAALFRGVRDKKAAERQFAASKLRGLQIDRAPGPDEAAAIGLDAYACRSGEVGAVLPKAIREGVHARA